MARALSWSLLFLSFTAGPSLAQGSQPRFLDDIRFLADDRLDGRLTGTPAADTAAAYIQRRFEAIGLQAPATGWFQEFRVEGNLAQRLALTGRTGRNVIGLLPGSDPARREDIVVVGAHYDHLGSGAFGALDPDSAGRAHNGADDNASGVAALLNIAQRLAQDPPARTIMFIAFSGEELGLLGSSHYVREPVAPMARTVAMVNFDMVGRLRDNRLIIYGTETAREFNASLDSLNWSAAFDLRKRGDGFGPSDQSAFFAVKKPVLHFFTDLHEDYHRSTDDWEKINVAGMLKVTEFATRMILAIADAPAPPTFVEQPNPHAQAALPPAAQTPGYGAYLGTVPDMAGDVAAGVRLSGVRSGSPAEKAGLRRDDVITRIGAHRVADLQAMTDALRAHRPGDIVAVEVERDGKPVTLTVTLGVRGT
jgi:hypothetical protein